VPRCTKASLRGATPYQFRVRAQSREGSWGSFSKPSEPVTTSTILHMAPSRPRAWPIGQGCVEVKWKGPAGQPSSRFELQWRKADTGTWERHESCLVATASFVTPTLHQGSVYVFRARASVATYTGDTWTNFSQTSAPVRPLAKDPTHVDGDSDLARNLSESKQFMQEQGVPFPAAPDPVMWPVADSYEHPTAPADVVPPRKRTEGGGDSAGREPPNTGFAVVRRVQPPPNDVSHKAAEQLVPSLHSRSQAFRSGNNPVDTLD